jgi:hypothetical protein
MRDFQIQISKKTATRLNKEVTFFRKTCSIKIKITFEVFGDFGFEAVLSIGAGEAFSG